MEGVLGSTLAEFYSMADSSTTTGHIPILFFWRLLGSWPATQRYKVHAYAIKTHEIVVLCRGATLAEFYSIADFSTTAGRISILFPGGCWA